MATLDLGPDSTFILGIFRYLRLDTVPMRLLGSECAQEQGAGQSKTGRIYLIYLLMRLRKMSQGVTEVVIYVNDV